MRVKEWWAGVDYRDRMLDLAALSCERKSANPSAARNPGSTKRVLQKNCWRVDYVPSTKRWAASTMRCTNPRKQALAWLIKRNTMAGDERITRELEMGHRSNVSRA